ncbi:MAG: ABC transporter permease subunit [Planctomycetota bacterium]|nr:ABC transporter permease subunit [Planctomycetota bacterium]MDA1106669.1 ABC transporter permease subunit [Planctomycetota bacterium]
MTTVIRSLSRVLPTNPIVIRLVQGGSRRQRHLVIRGVFLGGLSALLLLALGGAPGSAREIAQGAATALSVLAFGQVLLICLLTPIFMSGAIAQEAEPRTWEILLTTPLSGLQIVLGNLFGRLFFVVSLVLSSLPLFLVLQGFGGVPPSAILASSAIALATALLLGSVAIALSLTRFAGRRSIFAFYAAVVSWLVVTAAADALLRVKTPSGTAATTLATPLNPMLALESILKSATYASHSAEQLSFPASWWLGSPAITYGVLTIGASGVLLAFSLVVVRQAGLASRGSLGRVEGRSRVAKHVGKNPISWRELHLRAQRRGVLLARWTIVPLGLVIGFLPPLLHWRGDFSTATWQSVVAALVGAETLILALIALNTAATAVTSEREDGSLDILLATPIQPAAYLGGKLIGLVRYLLPLALVPVVTLAASALYALLAGGTDGTSTSVSFISRAQQTLLVPAILPESAIEYPVSLLAFLSLAVMLGLSMSVRCRGTVGAVLWGSTSTLGPTGAVALAAVAMAGASAILGGCGLGLTPFSLLAAAVFPQSYLLAAVEDGSGVAQARQALAIGTGFGAAVCIGLVWAVHRSLQSQFMFLVRRFAGTR